jgi:periplasmic protein TonB
MHFHRAYPLALVFSLHALIVIACLGIYTPRPPDAAPEIMATLLDPMPAPEAAPVTEHPKPTPRPSVQREIRPVAAPTTQLTPPTAAPTPIPKPLPAEPVVTAPSAPIDPMPVAKAPAPAPEPVVPPREDAQGLHNSAPIYPSLSRQLGEQGRVTRTRQGHAQSVGTDRWERGRCEARAIQRLCTAGSHRTGGGPALAFHLRPARQSGDCL